MSMRVIYADIVPSEEALALAKLINTLPETSALREALAEMLDSLSRGEDVYMFFYPANTVEKPLPEGFDSDGGA